MTLRLYDTRTRSVRVLDLVQEGRVGVYACGPSAAAAPHVGHLRSAVVLDVLHRWLRESGLAVTVVRSVTDLDDKVVHDASHDDEPWWALSTRTTRQFSQATAALGCLPPTAEPRVSGHASDVVALVEQLVAAGAAYESWGDVYLSVRAVPSYGELSRQSPDALKASEKAVAHGHSGERRDALDVSLWRAARDGEPGWPSPWGPGRPSTHAQCTATATAHLGRDFDLHLGGVDLVFPHHENELAQAVATGQPFARHWLHHGLVSGPAPADTVLAEVGAPELRYALVAPHHRTGLTWTPEVAAEAQAAYGRLETFVRKATAAVGDTGVDPALSAASWEEFATAMDDDLGVPQALAAVHAGVRAGNALLAARELPALAATLSVVRRMLGVLGLDPVGQWPGAGGGELSGVVDALVGIVVEARADARARKDWTQADAIRDRLTASGIALEDTPDGVQWRLS